MLQVKIIILCALPSGIIHLRKIGWLPETFTVHLLVHCQWRMFHQGVRNNLKNLPAIYEFLNLFLNDYVPLDGAAFGVDGNDAGIHMDSFIHGT
jgi:hypothetical protein